MKNTFTLSMIAGCMLLVSSLCASAANPSEDKHKVVSKEQVRSEIIRNISCPDFVAENSSMNDVKAIVQVDEKGRVSVTDINSGNPKLLAYINAQLQNLIIKNVTSPEKFILVVKFRVE